VASAPVAVKRWRVSQLGRLASVAVCLLFWTLGVFLLSEGAHTSDRITGGVFLVVAPIAVWLFAFRPFVALGTDQVVVQNPWRGLTIPLGAVLGAHGGYGGLSLNVRGLRRPVTAWAVQKANWSTWRGRETRADRVAAAIMAAAYANGVEPVTYEERPPGRHAM